MKYVLDDVAKDEVDILINYKLDTIINDDILEEEQEKIINYVKENSLKRINDSKFIKVNEKVIGCVVVYDYEDGVLLDELYIESNYRGLGIGTNILRDILKRDSIVYLWVYKNNEMAFNLYHKLGFKVIEETENRYFMKYKFMG